MLTEIGSPRGAICSTSIRSPGTQPISMSLRKISLFSKWVITASCPGFRSESFMYDLNEYKTNLVGWDLFTNFGGFLTAPALYFACAARNPQPKMSQIHFFTQNITLPLRERNRLKPFLSNLAKQEGKRLDSLNYIFCTDKALLAINKEYLNHDFYTDIITFDLSETPGQLSGEIYISIDRVRDNAKTQGTTIKEELHRVIFHGLLHLCGYKDKKPGEIRVMREKEEYYLRRYLK